MEIEYKYLVDKIPFELDNFTKLEIKQGYISVDPVIRVRQSNNDFILTIKGKGNFIREEFELPLSKEQFDKLWCKVETKKIDKTRYIIPIDGKYSAELDIYKEELEGLLTVEVEFESEEDAESFSPPNWFGENVTMKNDYKNSSLSVYGLPKEKLK